MKFIKMQGTGNDFIIIDEIKYRDEISAYYEIHGENRSAIALKLCDRNTGVGADGILFVLPSEKAHAMMRIFNSDGSEALMCGNGLRCFGRYLLDELGTDAVEVETLNAQYPVKRVVNFSQGIQGFEILMNNVMHHGKTEAVLALHEHFMATVYENYVFDFFTVSNPHVVTLNHPIIPSDEVLVAIGSYANGLESPFKSGVNVNFATVLDLNEIYVRTFERGVGITKSCGTGMTSSVTKFAISESKFDQEIEVYNDGGMIRCRVVPMGQNHFHVHFIGNASHEFEFEDNIKELMKTSSTLKVNKIVNAQEVSAYAQFLARTNAHVQSKISSNGLIFR